jgi:hypothetical protein
MGLWFAGRNRTPGVFDRGVINSKFRRILEGCFRRLVLGLPAIRHGIRLFTAWFVIGDIHLHSITFPVIFVISMIFPCDRFRDPIAIMRKRATPKAGRTNIGCAPSRRCAGEPIPQRRRHQKRNRHAQTLGPKKSCISISRFGQSNLQAAWI